VHTFPLNLRLRFWWKNEKSVLPRAPRVSELDRKVGLAASFTSGWIFNSSRSAPPPTRSANRHARIRSPMRAQGTIFRLISYIFAEACLDFRLLLIIPLRFDKDCHLRRYVLSLRRFVFSLSLSSIGDLFLFFDTYCSNCVKFVNKDPVALPESLFNPGLNSESKSTERGRLIAPSIDRSSE